MAGPARPSASTRSATTAWESAYSRETVRQRSTPSTCGRFLQRRGCEICPSLATEKPCADYNREHSQLCGIPHDSDSAIDHPDGREQLGQVNTPRGCVGIPRC